MAPLDLYQPLPPPHAFTHPAVTSTTRGPAPSPPGPVRGPGRAAEAAGSPEEEKDDDEYDEKDEEVGGGLVCVRCGPGGVCGAAAQSHQPPPMPAMPPHPTHRRRGIDSGCPPAILPLLADQARRAPDVLGVGARRPPSPATTKIPAPGPPPQTCWPGLPCHLRRLFSPSRSRPQRCRVRRRVRSAPGHSTDGHGHSEALHSAAGPARPDPLVVNTVGHVLAGGAGIPTCPDGCAPADGPPRNGHQGLLRHREAVASIPGPTVGCSGRRRHLDTTHRSPMPGPGVGPSLLRVAAQPPPTGGHPPCLACPHASHGRGTTYVSPRAVQVLPSSLGPPITARGTPSCPVVT